MYNVKYTCNLDCMQNLYTGRCILCWYNDKHVHINDFIGRFYKFLNYVQKI